MSQYYTFADYRRISQSHGVDYRFKNGIREDQWVGQGTMQQQMLRGGMTLAASDVHNRFEYTATAEHSGGVVIRLMLQGHVDVQLPRRGRVMLRAGMAMTAAHRDAVTMSGDHPGDTRLRGVSLLVPGDVDRDLLQQPALERALDEAQLRCQHWAIPHTLMPLLGQLFDSPWQGDLDALWREGLAYQVLATGLNADDIDPQRPRPLRANQRARLEAVREHLDASPEQAHSLANLARLACMSPSALRGHFSRHYGCTLFEYLHEQRMRHAERGLREGGWTVEQAATACGYRHASNFAAAFRKRFGLVPSRWRTGPSPLS